MLRNIFVFFLAFAFSAVVFTAPTVQNDQPAETPQDVKVVHFENQSDQTGKYSVIYELSNGIIHFETGELWTDNHDRAQDIVEGTYWFVGPDNSTYKIEYFVLQDDFQPNIGDGSGVNFNVLKSAVG